LQGAKARHLVLLRKAEGGAAATAAPQASARDRLAAISTSLEELKARAILEPSPENVTAYVRFQREQLDRSSMFADVWQRALWQDPGLDYTLQRPVSTLGKRAWIDQRKGDRDLVMAQLSQRYGVFYFYASSCGACDIFSPILKAVSDKYGLSVLAVSMDGGPSAVFPGYMVDSGQYERLGHGHRPAGARARPVRQRDQAAHADRLRHPQPGRDHGPGVPADPGCRRE
jgi:conjugal transfer pilus assembly protein TraF